MRRMVFLVFSTWHSTRGCCNLSIGTSTMLLMIGLRPGLLDITAREIRWAALAMLLNIPAIWVIVRLLGGSVGMKLPLFSVVAASMRQMADPKEIRPDAEVEG